SFEPRGAVTMKIGVVVALVGALPLPARGEPTTRDLLGDPRALAVWLRDRDPVIAAARAPQDAAAELGAQVRVLLNPQLAATDGGFVLGETTPAAPHLPLDQTTNLQLGVAELV